MAVYRTMIYIPTSAIHPVTSSVETTTEVERVRAVNAAMTFADAVSHHSAGMCELDVSIRVLSDTLPASVYWTYGDQQVIHPNNVATFCNDFGTYDMFVVLNGAAMTTATTYRGVAGAASSTPFIWVKIGSDETRILVHEFMHAMTAYLGSVVAEFTNFPSCAGEPSAHCATAYGFENDLDPAWFDGFLRGTLSDGTGINQAGWSVQTPTERGAKNVAHNRPQNTVWGVSSPMRVR